ncbi:hypothetical protein A2U01_0104659, partial [Trifolium medium]|nr:hypothetical protein [Trifolium medium]
MATRSSTGRALLQ